jgi:hypothetical protein
MPATGGPPVAARSDARNNPRSLGKRSAPRAHPVTPNPAPGALRLPGLLDGYACTDLFSCTTRSPVVGVAHSYRTQRRL